MKNNFHSKICSYCLVAAFIFAGMHCFAQDTIVKRGGQQILGKILEVSLTEVKYKKAELTDGPVYIEDKATITKIKYQGGYVDLFPEIMPKESATGRTEKKKEDYYFQKYPKMSVLGKDYFYKDDIIDERQMHDILLSIQDPEMTAQIRRAKVSRGLRYVGFLAIPLGVSAIFYGVNNTIFNSSYQKRDENLIFGLAGAGALMFSASVYFNVDRRYRNAKAVRIYQQKYMLKQ